MYIQANNINIGMKLNLLHKKKPTTQVEEAFDLQKFTSLQSFKEYIMEKYFKLEKTPLLQQQPEQPEQEPLDDQKNSMILIVKVQKDWLNNNTSKPNIFKRIEGEEEWNQVIQAVLLAHTKEQSIIVGENLPKAIIVEFKLKCKPAKRMIKKQLKELKKQKKQIKKQFVSLKEENTSPSVAIVAENMYPTLNVPVEEVDNKNNTETNTLKVKRELLLEKKLKLQEMRAKLKMMKLEAKLGEDNGEKIEKKLEKHQAKLQRKKEKLEKKENHKTEKLIKKQEKRELKLKEKELKLEQSKDDVQLFEENGQALVLKPEIKKIFIDGNNMFFMNRAMRHILLELKNRKLAEDLISTTSKMYSQLSELLWNQQLHLMQVCFDSSSQQVINNPNVTFVVTSAKQEGYPSADDLLVELANRQNIACLLDSCLFVTSDRVLRQRLRSVGNGAKCVGSANWMKFIYSHLCSNTNELSLDDWLLQLLNGLNH